MILDIKNISKSYGKKIVVDNVSLNVKQGEIVGLLGPNGAGKTNSFYIIVGLIKPKSGDIYIKKQNITSNTLPILSISLSVNFILLIY